MEPSTLVEALPTAWANYISMGIFVVLGIAVWLIPRRVIFAEAPDDAIWRDIRIWASALIALQLMIYYVFT